jgi:hypothetical protein
MHICIYAYMRGRYGKLNKFPTSTSCCWNDVTIAPKEKAFFFSFIFGCLFLLPYVKRILKTSPKWMCMTAQVFYTTRLLKPITFFASNFLHYTKVWLSWGMLSSSPFPINCNSFLLLLNAFSTKQGVHVCVWHCGLANYIN